MKLKYRDVKKAVIGSAGIISVIAQKCNCEWHTAKTFIDKHPKLSLLLKNEREKMVDLAENKLLTKVNEGDNWAIGRVLDGPGKRRGWYPKSEVEHGMNKETSKTFFDWITKERKENQPV
jgi:hypothetical protein